MQLGVLAGGTLFSGVGGRLALLGASVAGSMLLRGKKEPAGKINDLRVSSSSYGRGIPLVYGTMRVTGNMIWCTDFEEEKNYITQKGKRKNGTLGKKKEKKGKATETYEYFANFAMGLCAGPVDSLLRVWADNNLIYDKLNPDNEELKNVGFSQDQNSGGGKRDMKNPARKKGHHGDSSRFQFRFYNGSEEQLPDPFIMDKQGENSVAFRGTSYLFFEKFALADFGNRIPTITAEVATKVDRKPVIRTFENMEPRLGWTTPNAGKVVFDPIRKRLYHLGIRDEITYVRTYDMEAFKEISRIPVHPPSAVPQLPQTFMGQNNITMELTSFGNFLGVAANGDFIFQLPFGNNYNPIGYVDPVSMRLKAVFGAADNQASLGEPYGKLWRGLYAFPFVMNGSDTKATPTPVTGVTTIGGGVAFFDDELHRPVSFSDGLGYGGVGPIGAGAYGTDKAVTVLQANLYSLEGRLYVASVDQPLATQASVYDSVSIDPFKLILRFPPTEMDPNNEVFISNINFAAYCAGARAYGVIASIQSGSPTLKEGVYALKIDPETNEIIWLQYLDGLNETYPNPLSIPCYLGGNKYCWIGGLTTTFKYVTVDFRAETYDYTSIDSDKVPYPNGAGQYYYSDLESIVYTSNRFEDGETKWVLAAFDKRSRQNVTVSSICQNVAEKAGIQPYQMAFSELTNDEEITGYMIENPTPARDVIEELSNVYMFDVVESDNKLKFKTRGGEPVLTISQEELGIVSSDVGNDNDYYVETRMQEVELPERVNLSHIDPDKDYETGTQHYKRPLRPLSVMNSREMLEISLNMAMTPERAKTLAQRILFAAWSERTSHEYTFPRDYLYLEPSDVINVELDNGEIFTDRITDVEIGADLSLKIHSVSHIAGSYELTTTTGKRGGLIKIPRPSAPSTRAGILDVPYLSDADVSEDGGIVYYWGALAYSDGFRFGALMAQSPGGDSEIEGYANFDAIWGTVIGKVPAPSEPPEVTDLNTKITLSPAFDFNATSIQYVWESIPDEEWPSEKNMIVIGNEVIQFKDVEEHPDGTVTISTLIRGAKGTGENVYKHKDVAEDWVLILPNTVNTSEEFVDNTNTPMWFMIQSQSYLPPAMTKVTKTLTGATRKPWQVGNVRRQARVDGVRILWDRATRWGGSLKNGTGAVPLNEEVEQYEVFILKDPYNMDTWDPENETLFHSNMTVTGVSYYDLDEETLAGWSLSAQSDLHVVIYQISSVIGRGYARGAALPFNVLSLL